MTESTIHHKRIEATRLARRSSDDFSEAYGDSALDSIAPFERDEILLGRLVGLGAVSHEAEMLAALPSHPNIIKLHVIIACRHDHDAFLEGASAFFIILERLESTLTDTIRDWKRQNSFNPSRSLMSLSSSFRDTSGLDTAENEGGSLVIRLRVAAALTDAVQYLHSQGVIFHDLKPQNVGIDKQGTLKCLTLAFLDLYLRIAMHMKKYMH